MNILDLAKQAINSSVVYEDKESDEVNDYEAPAYDELPEIEKKVVDFMLLNPDPPDEKIHEFAQSLGLDPDEFETIIYKLLTKLVKDEYGEQPEEFEDEENEES